MINFNIVEGYPEYDFADRTVWSDDRLRAAGVALMRFLRTHEPAESVPEELLLDANQALENITFEITMRKRD